ncbi:hypothetical protein ABK040_001776 [Willaertia magna]
MLKLINKNSSIKLLLNKRLIIPSQKTFNNNNINNNKKQSPNYILLNNNCTETLSKKFFQNSNNYNNNEQQQENSFYEFKEHLNIDPQKLKKLKIKLFLFFPILTICSLTIVLITYLLTFKEISLEFKKLLNSTLTTTNEIQLFILNYFKNTKIIFDDYKTQNYLEIFLNDFQRYPMMYGILLLNLGVFTAIKLKSSKSLLFFEKHFVLSVQNIFEKRYYTLLTSAFTHFGLLHFLFNIYGLYQTTPMVYENYGPLGYLAFYFGAAIFSSYCSLLVKLLFGIKRGSIGASGAVLGLLMSYLLIAEKQSSSQLKLSLIFLPRDWSFEPKQFLFYYFIGEILFNFITKFKMDTAGHLGGLLFGYLSLKLIEDSKVTTIDKKNNLIELRYRNSYYLGESNGFKREGKGISIGENYIYVGELKNSKRDGLGTFITLKKTSDGKAVDVGYVSGEWKDNQIIRK